MSQSSIGAFVAGEKLLEKLTAKASTHDQVTENAYGVTRGSGATDSRITSNDLVKILKYPDPSTGAPGGVDDQETLAYNALGEVTWKKDQEGNEHTYEYDDRGRLIHDRVTTLATGFDGTVRRISTTYDALDRPVKVTSYDNATVGSGTILNEVEYEYDKFGVVKTIWQDWTGVVDKVAPGLSPKVAYTYSFPTNGTTGLRRTSTTYPGGTVIDDIYSSGTDDTLSRLSGRKKGSSWIFRESYLGLGRLVEREFLDLGGGYGRLVWTLIGSSLDSPNQDYYEGLDRHGRIDHLIAKLGSTLLNEYLYSYNYNSQITLREDKVGKIGTSEEFDQGYTYDNLGRVTDHKRGGYSGSWTYITRHECFTMDRSGNVTAYYVGTSSTCGSTVPLTYNDSNELAYVNEVPYGYNKPGDMTDRGSNINKVFDAWNRIIDIDQGSGSYLARYKYNGLGQTIKRTNSSTLFDTYYYFSAESQILEELKVSDGSSISWYVWGSQYIDDIVMRGKANASDDRYYVLDARNNVTTVLSNAGSVQTRFVYDAYGMPKQLSADWSTWQTITDDLHLFTGRLFHKDHAQTDYRARLQDPELGVFVQRDPIGIWGDESQFGNVYSYTENDPTNLTDPLGLWSWDEHRRQTASAFREFWDKLGGDNPVRSDWCYNRVLDKLQNYNLSQDANDMYYHDLKRHYNRSVSNGAGGYVTDLIVAASYDAQYKTYLQSEFSYFEDAVTFGVKNCMSKRECEFFCDEAASALGHLLHSWQDYFAHAIHFPPPNKIVWTGRFGFIVNSLCSPDFTCFWLVIPSSSKPKRTLFPPMIIDSGEHGNNEVNVDFPTEGAARIRSSERYGAFKLSSAEYKDLMIDFLVTCCD